jgi:CRP-like cAMP-binding protein
MAKSKEATVSNLLLRKLENFVNLTDDDRQALQVHTDRVQNFGAREDLVKKGQEPPRIYLVLEGWAYRYKQLEDGRRQIVAFYLPGDLCDPMTFLLREKSHSLGSLTPVSVVRLHRDEMSALISSSAILERALWLDMLYSAEIQREWTVNLGRRTATERMAHLFCEIPLRLKAVGLSDGVECEMPATQTDLADALGLSSVHVSRTLQELRAAGLVELRGRKLTIRDEYALRELAMFDPSYLRLPRADGA